MAIFTEYVIIDALLIFVSLALFLFNYIVRTYSIFTRAGIYGETPKFPFGNIQDIVYGRKIHLEFWANHYKDLKEKKRKFGGYFSFIQPILMVTDPDLIKQIFIKDFEYFHDRGFYYDEEIDPLSGHLVNLKGEKWKKLRTKLTPTFSSGKLKGMFEMMVETSKELGICMGKEADGRDVDIKNVLGRFTTDIIGTCAFGIECNSLKDPDVLFYTYSKKIFEKSFKDRMKELLGGIFPTLYKIFRIKIIKKEHHDFYTGVVRSVIDHRKSNSITRKDLMQLLINLMDKPASEAVSFNEVAAQAFVFFLAGYETSATAMTFTLYELAENQDVQAKLREEIEEVTKKHGGLNYDAIMDMPYLDKILAESLRKYPPFAFTLRVCNQNYPIPNTDITLPKNVQVIIPIFPMQRDEEYFPNPDVFDPERFSEEAKRSRHPFAYIPFGEGPRICIGMRFALLVAKVGLIELVSKYNFKVSPKTELPMKFDEENFSLTALGKIWLTVTEI